MLPALRRLRTLPVCFLAAAPFLMTGCGEVQVGTAKSVSTLAGAPGGGGFFDGAPADPVRFDSPSGVAVIGTDRYVADRENHVIRRVDNSGNVSTFAGKFGVAGTADGTGSVARFSGISAITAVGTFLYLCDNNAIRSISSAGAVSTIAGIPGVSGASDNSAGRTGVLFSSPGGIATNGATAGTILYVADTGNHKIRRVIAATGATTTVAGSGEAGSTNGLGTAARFSSPKGVTPLGSSLLYVADTGNHTIRKVTLSSSFGDVTTLAGLAGDPGSSDGPGLQARFRSPAGIATDGNALFVADSGNHILRTVSQDGDVVTLAGSAGTAGFADGTGGTARFSDPAGIGIAGAGSSVFAVADRGNHVLRQVTLAGNVTTLAGNPPQAGTADGTGPAARFSGPGGIALLGGDRYVADSANHTIRRITPGGEVTTLAGFAGTAGSADGSGSAARFRSPGGIAASGGDLYIADTENHTIRKVTSTGDVSTLAGNPGATGTADGTGTSARFNAPRGIVALGSDLYVADTGNHAIRKVTLSGVVTTLAGLAGTPGSADGSGSIARFDSPRGIASIGTALYVTDTGNHTIRKIATPSGAVSTFAGSARSEGYADASEDAARFSSPDGIAAVGSVLYVADPGNHAVRRIGSTRSVATFVGTPDAATTRDGNASGALLNSPAGIAGTADTICFTDVRENVVREIPY